MEQTKAKIYESEIATLDINRLPLVVQNIKNINPTIEQMSGHVAVIEQVLADTTGALTVISDMRKLEWVRTKSIVYLGKQMNRIDKANKNRLKLHIIVSEVKLLRIAIPIFNFFARLDAEHVVFTSMDEAVDYASLENGIPFYE